MDTICQHYYGHLAGAVEAVLSANQGLADIAQPYRAGVLILLPDLPAATDATVRLWD